MKTLHSAYHSSYHSKVELARENREQVLPLVLNSSREVLAILSATTMATILVFAGIWAAGLDATDLVGAVSWGLGLIFLGNFIDKNGPTAVLHLASGLAMWVVAWLQNTVSADFTMVSAVILAAWASVAVFRKLR